MAQTRAQAFERIRNLLDQASAVAEHIGEHYLAHQIDDVITNAVAEAEGN